MNAPSQDIKDVLEQTSSLGLTFATDLFVSEMPETPDASVGVYDTGGEDPEVNYTYERPTIQIRVRGAKGDYDGAYDTIKSIADVLNGLVDETVGSTRYVAIWQQSDIISLGYDDNRRPLLTVNFRMHRTDA